MQQMQFDERYIAHNTIPTFAALDTISQKYTEMTL